jgi:hypothetical protein
MRARLSELAAIVAVSLVTVGIVVNIVQTVVGVVR